jgi:hypothetical protein
MWNFASMRTLAIRQLSSLTTPVDRVVLGRKYGIEHWLGPAYQAICERDEWLSEEEGSRLGLEDVLKIGRARQLMIAHATVKVAVQRDAVLYEVFSISSSGLAPSEDTLISAGDDSDESPGEACVPSDVSVSSSQGDKSVHATPCSADIASNSYTVYAPVAASVRQSLPAALGAVDLVEQKEKTANAALRDTEAQRKAAEHTYESDTRPSIKEWVEDWIGKHHTAQRKAAAATAEVDAAHARLWTLIRPDTPLSKWSCYVSEGHLAKISSTLAAVDTAERCYTDAAQAATQARKHAEYSKAWHKLCTRSHSRLPTEEHAVALVMAQQQLTCAIKDASHKAEQEQDAKDQTAGAHLALAASLSSLLTAANTHSEAAKAD